MEKRRQIREFIKKLQDANYTVRSNAANWLGRCGSDASVAVPALIEVLRDKNGEVRYHAARALGHIRHPLAVEALSKRLFDRAEYVREAAAEALKRIGTPEAEKALHDPFLRFLRLASGRA
jgi:vesicle coat complex subunit